MSCRDIVRSVRCKKCRTILFSSNKYPPVNCHGELLEQSLTSDPSDTDANLDTCNEMPCTTAAVNCETLEDKSLLFFNGEPYPPFIADAIDEASWQKGKLFCPKCKARLGSFNFVNVSYCSCHTSLLPAVHLHATKVDYVLPLELIKPHISLPLTVTPLPVKDNLSTVTLDEGPSANFENDTLMGNRDGMYVGYCSGSEPAGVHAAYLSGQRHLAPLEVHVSEDVNIERAKILSSRSTKLSTQVRANEDYNFDVYLDKCTTSDNFPVHKESSADSDQSQVWLQEKPSVSLPDTLLGAPEEERENSLRRRRRRKRARRQLFFSSTLSSSPEPVNLDSSNSEEEANSLIETYEDLTHPSHYEVIKEDSSEDEVFKENSSDEKMPREIPDHLICPVCLDLLYCPFVVKPCSHIFCEPCLRRLAKPAPTNTACPLCRELIGICTPCSDISKEVKEKFPEQFQERHNFEKQHNSQHLPLPWLRDYRFFGLRGRLHPGHYGPNWTGWRTVFWIFILDCLGLILVLFIKWILGDYDFDQRQLEHQARQRLLDPPANSLELETSFSRLQELTDVINETIFSNVVE